MSKELKPCPFCGQDVSIGPVDDCTHYWYVCCEDCDITRFIFGSKQEVIKIWNTRPAEDALKAEVGRLKNELGIQKNLARQACFESNRAYDEVETWKKMFYDLYDKQAKVSTDPKVIVINTDKEKGGRG